MLKKLSLALIVILALKLIGCAVPGTITEAGSTTVQPVAEKLAEAFRQKNPHLNVIIQGGGSSVGIKSAAEGTVDIGAASRELKPDEPKLVKHLLAIDALAIVVHPANKISGLTKDQVKRIFAAEISNWSQVGGSNEPITVVSREEGSGTREAFQELVMGKDTHITAKAILFPSNGAVRTSVSTTPLAIAYLSLGYLDTGVKALAIDGVEPTAANAKAGKYTLVRPLYFLTKEPPTGEVKKFIDFCLSEEGQDIVEKEGYIRAE